jgi:hypothetical protein
MAMIAKGMTCEARILQELGGVEYRALRLLSRLVPVVSTIKTTQFRLADLSISSLHKSSSSSVKKRLFLPITNPLILLGIQWATVALT